MLDWSYLTSRILHPALCHTLIEAKELAANNVLGWRVRNSSPRSPLDPQQDFSGPGHATLFVLPQPANGARQLTIF